jgi:hypothetical protein
MEVINQMTLQEWTPLKDIATRVRSPAISKLVDQWLAANPPFVHGSAEASASTLVFLFLDFLGVLVPEM